MLDVHGRFNRTFDIITLTSKPFIWKNLNIDRISLRGYEMLNVQIIPFEYNFSNKTLKIYTSVEIGILTWNIA